MTALVPLAVVVFVSTNLDDLFVLIALFSDPTQRPRDVITGQFLGMAILTLAALACALAASSLPAPYVGLLGLLPLLIGLSRLVFRRGEREPEDVDPKGGPAENVFLAAAITASNGGDNIALYVPLFVGRSWREVALVLIVFSILTTVWCAVGRLIVAHPRIGTAVRRFGSRCLPWLFIALGVYILLSSRAYTLLSQ